MAMDLTTKRIGETGDYRKAVILDGEQIATTRICRTTARSQFHAVTLADGTEIEGEFPSVKQAAAAAAAHLAR